MSSLHELRVAKEELTIRKEMSTGAEGASSVHRCAARDASGALHVRACAQKIYLFKLQRDDSICRTLVAMDKRVGCGIESIALTREDSGRRS
jgi:hypothetical protein